MKPSYREVTLIWALSFGVRIIIEILLFQSTKVQDLGFFKLLLGWPYTIIILILSYIYGTWRLKRLKGPSVEEFIQKVESPWVGQQRGF